MMKEFFLKQKKLFIIFLIFFATALISGYYAKFGRQDAQIGNVQKPSQSVQNSVTSLSEPSLSSPNSSPAETSQPPVSNQKQDINQEETISSPEPFLNLNTINAVLVVSEKRYEAAVPAGSTVLDLMETIKKQGEFKFNGKNSPGLGFFVEEINGVKNSPSANAYWIYYVNEEAAPVGVSSYVLKNNDVINWKYEKPNF